MSGKSNTSLWLKFFRGAGIESGIDTKYALIFDENRIRMDMLMDLDKEILKDMGVNAMGDIIAILKHAKKVHDETKEQAVETHKPVPSSSTGAKPETTVSKVVQQNPTVSKEISLKRPEPVERKALMSQVVQKVVKVTTVGADTSPKAVSRIPDVSEKKIVVLNKRSNSDQMLREEVPVQKKIRVLPEHEGKYKIKMPEGTTPRTQKVLQSRLGPPESRTATTEKKTVFDRLGDSKVSSSTSSVLKSDSLKPVVPTKVPEVSTTKSSVFQRLGDKGKSESETAPRTASVRSLIDVESKPAQRSLVSRVDPRVYAEKTLRTIPSKISVPAMSSGISQRLKSEVTTASPSSSSRIISSKSSVSSSGSSGVQTVAFEKDGEISILDVPVQQQANLKSNEPAVLFLEGSLKSIKNVEQQLESPTQTVVFKMESSPDSKTQEPILMQPRVVKNNFAVHSAIVPVTNATTGDKFTTEVKAPISKSSSPDNTSLPKPTDSIPSRRPDSSQLEIRSKSPGNSTKVPKKSKSRKRSNSSYSRKRSSKKRSKASKKKSSKKKRKNEKRTKRNYRKRKSSSEDLTSSSSGSSDDDNQKSLRKRRPQEENQKPQATSCNQGKSNSSMNVYKDIKNSSHRRGVIRIRRDREESPKRRPAENPHSAPASSLPARDHRSRPLESRKKFDAKSELKVTGFKLMISNKANAAFEVEKEGKLSADIQISRKSSSKECIEALKPPVEESKKLSETSKESDSEKKLVSVNTKQNSERRNSNSYFLDIDVSDASLGSPSRCGSPDMSKELKQPSPQKLSVPDASRDKTEDSYDLAFQPNCPVLPENPSMVEIEDIASIQLPPEVPVAQMSCSSVKNVDPMSLKNIVVGCINDKMPSLHTIPKVDYQQQPSSAFDVNMSYLLVNDQCVGSTGESGINVSFQHFYSTYQNPGQLQSPCSTQHFDQNENHSFKSKDYSMQGAISLNRSNRWDQSSLNRSATEGNASRPPVGPSSGQATNSQYRPSQPVRILRDRSYTSSLRIPENPFSYDHTFVRPKNITETNQQGEAIVRIARPIEDKEALAVNPVSLKLMEKMGWSPGLGLGKHNQGRKAAIAAGKARSTNVGLGFGKG